MTTSARTDWSLDEVSALYKQPLLDLIFQAATVHRTNHDPQEVQVCQLINIKTGGCPETCKYCAQSSLYQTGVQPQKLMEKDSVVEQARRAKERGATRICMGAAWREVRNSPQFDRILDMVKEANELGIEVCATLGMLTEEQAQRLADAGLYAYNHNLDTSKEYYSYVISSRTYQDRLDTLDCVEKAGLSVCCGGIIGMGETERDRISLLHTLATRDKHPESVPVNCLVPIEGTPMEDLTPISIWEILRMVATARILMPRAMVRLSAGREKLSQSEQALCFLAGANSFFSGDKMLTVPTRSFEEDHEMLSALGMHLRRPFKEAGCPVKEESLEYASV